MTVFSSFGSRSAIHEAAARAVGKELERGMTTSSSARRPPETVRPLSSYAGAGSEGCGKAVVHQFAERRAFLKLILTAPAGFACHSYAVAQVNKVAPKPQKVLTPDAALDRLMKGNARYVEGVSRRHDFNHEREPLRTGQNPFAAVLSCADSRVAPEYCFDTARGDVFVCRVAGNFASDDIVASLEYAVQGLN